MKKNNNVMVQQLIMRTVLFLFKKYIYNLE